MENMETKLKELFKHYFSIEQVNDAVYHTLKESLIIRPYLPVGTRLNSYDLAKLFDVSRTPVQSALMRLEFEELIRYDSKRGYVVYEYSFKESRDYNEYSLGIYAISFPLAQKRMDNYYKNLIKTGLEQTEHETDVFNYVVLDNEFHRLIVQSTGNEALLKAFNEMTIKGCVMRLNEKISSSGHSYFVEEHKPLNRKLYELIIGNDEAALAEFTSVHNAHNMVNVCNWISK